MTKRRSGASVYPFVGQASVPAPSSRAGDDHRHVGQIFCKLVLDDYLSQCRQVKLAVRLQGPHEPLESVPQEHVVNVVVGPCRISGWSKSNHFVGGREPVSR